MTDRPIIFSAAMVMALLAGRKTQTRRLLSIRGRRGFTEFGRSDTPGYDWHFRDARMLWHDLRHDELLAKLPWQVGDRLWVRENILQSKSNTTLPSGEAESYWHSECIEYCADAPEPQPRFLHPDRYGSAWMGRRPAIHMPRHASRLTLTVTDVRVQRLQEISAVDAEAEGWDGRGDPHMPWGTIAIHWLMGVWGQLHGDAAWGANPHVVALTFTVEQRNIDA